MVRERQITRKLEHELTDMPKNVFIFTLGPPTAGKSTQALFLIETMKGRAIKGRDIVPEMSYLESSRELIPDPVFLPRLQEALSHETSSIIVLDNIPRTKDQAKLLVKWANESGACLHIIQLILSEEEVVNRVAERQICPECGESYHPQLKPSVTPGLCDHHKTSLQKRQGDSPELVRKGYRDHKNSEVGITEIFQESDCCIHRISASGTVFETAERLFAEISPYIFYKNEMGEGYFKVRKILESLGVPHIFFSGMPVFIHGGRALMKDFDILVPDNSIESVAKKLGTEVGTKDSSIATTRFVDIGPGVEINSNLVVKTPVGDIVFVFEKILEGSRIIRFMGHECRIMGLNDLIIFKAALGRHGVDDFGKWKDDISDIEGLVDAQNVDWHKLLIKAQVFGMPEEYLREKLSLANVKFFEDGSLGI